MVEILGTVIRLNETQMTVDDGTGTLVVQLSGLDIKGQIGDNVKCTLLYAEEEELRADIIVWRVSPSTETLFQWQILSPPGSFGYPTLSFRKNDLLRYIRHAGCPVALEDLALVLDRPMQELQPLIHELQNDGAIYQNRQGEYVML